MTKPEARNGFQHRLLFFVILVSFAIGGIVTAAAQENTPPPEKRGVQLEFVPPPMEKGTISMGVYDSTGKLVRVLHQDAPAADFFPALNGLITFWDGKDDSGKLMPSGKYRAKGYMMGEMDFDGVAFLGNDFVDKDGNVQVHRIQKLAVTWEGNCYVMEGDVNKVCLDPAGNSVTDHSTKGMLHMLTVKDGKVWDTTGLGQLALPGVEHAVAVSTGRNSTIWVIDGTDVKQLASDGQVLRHLATKTGDPAPVQIEASPVSDGIFLLEQNDSMQRVRGLALISGSDEGVGGDGDATRKSLWKVAFVKTIVFSDKPDQVKDLLKLSDGKPFVAQDKITLKLAPNPLEQNKSGTLNVTIGIDDKGSVIKTADGLPLCRVSETPGLKWAAFALEADGKTITIFQSDGAVEQFKVTTLGNMLGFDAGDFDFDPATVK